MNYSTISHITLKTALASAIIALALVLVPLSAVHAQEGGDDFSTGSDGYNFSTGSSGHDFSTGSSGNDFSTGSSGYNFTTGSAGYDFTTGSNGYNFTTPPYGSSSYGGYGGGVSFGVPGLTFGGGIGIAAYPSVFAGGGYAMPVYASAFSGAPSNMINSGNVTSCTTPNSCNTVYDDHSIYSSNIVTNNPTPVIINNPAPVTPTCLSTELHPACLSAASGTGNELPRTGQLCRAIGSAIHWSRDGSYGNGTLLVIHYPVVPLYGVPPRYCSCAE